MNTLRSGGVGTVQPVPSARTGGVAQPLPPDGTLPGAVTSTQTRYEAAQATEQPAGTKRRANASAPLSGRLPVQASRYQDRHPASNDGVPLTVENNVPVVHPGSTFR